MQALAAFAVLAYTLVVTSIIALALKATIGIRVSPEDEESGIDSKLHRDPAYDLV